jgi:hypothetical protein
MKLFDDLFKDAKTHKWSLSKCAFGIGFFVLSVVLIKMCVLKEQELPTCFITYAALISGHDTMRRFIDKKKDENKIV